jgi:hypothetical protein
MPKENYAVCDSRFAGVSEPSAIAPHLPDIGNIGASPERGRGWSGFYVGFAANFGFFLFDARLVFSDKGAQLRIVILSAVERIVQRAFRVFF